MSNFRRLFQSSVFSVARKYTLFCLFLCMGWSLSAQQPVITTRFANPQYNCTTGEYCLDVEFQSNTTNQSLFGMNVRFFYDDSVLEFVNFRDFQGGYSAVAPNPPIINTGNSTSAATLFNLTGAAEFINGAVQLTNESVPAIVISTTGWTKLFQVCFTVDNAGSNPGNFCPSVIWDLISPTSGPGFLAGDDGVVITVVDPSPMFDSAPAIENVAQFNWIDDAAGSTMPYGAPSQITCISTLCGSSIAIVKTGVLNMNVVAPNAVANPGDVITYAFTVTNTGNVPLTNVSVSDPLVTVVGGPIASLAPGASDNTTFTASYVITQANINAGGVTNQATATGTPPTGPNVTDLSDNNSPLENDPTVTPIPNAPSIAIVKTGALNMNVVAPNAVANPGDVITYAFTVTNTGNVPLTNVSVSDPLVTVVGGPIASLAPGASDNTTFTASYVITQADVNAGGVTNQATAKGTPPTGPDVTDLSDNNSPLENDPTVTPIPNAPSIAIVKTGSYNVNTGVITYTYTATNTGNVPLYDITVTEQVGMFTGTGTLPTPSYVSGGAFLGGNAGVRDLAVGATITFSATYTVTQADISAGVVTNQALAAGTPPVGPGVTDLSDDDSILEDEPTDTPVDGNPNLGIVKIGVYDANNGSITYTYTVTNTGNVTLFDINVTENAGTFTGTGTLPLPIYVSGGANLDGDGDAADLAPGASLVFSATYTATSADLAAGQVTNQATARGTDPSGGPVTDLSDDTSPLEGEDDPTVTPLSTSCSCLEVTVTLDADCKFTLTPTIISPNCTGGTVRVMDNDQSNGGIIDCAGVWTYGLFDNAGKLICWGKVTAEDKTAPVLVCAPADVTLDCYDVNYVLNNHRTIGNVGTTSSPRPAAISSQTINNAEGTSTLPAGPCSLPSSMLVSDNITNLGYAYFKDNCFSCGCRVTLKWSDKVVFYSCEDMKTNGGIYAKIEREWVATDCNGMRSSYTQDIFFTRPELTGDFTWAGDGTSAPADDEYDWTVTYNSCTPDKSLIKKKDVTPRICSPFKNVDGSDRCFYIDEVGCNYSVQIKDTEFPICGGKGLKIDREMYIFDWCAGGIVDTFHILIKIGDFEGPSLEYAHHAPNALSTGPMDCTAAFPISAAGIKSTFGVEVKDNCGVANVSVSVKTKDRYVKGILVGPNTWEQVEYAVMNGMMTGLPVGRHRLIIDAYDGCYNATRDSFEFEVVDKIAPVMKCDDDLHVTLSNANGYTNGYAQVNAADIDEGSWDNCKLAWVRVRRNVPENCTASFIAKGYDSNGNGKLDPMPADGDWSKADGFDINGDGDLADFGETFILKEGKLMTPLQDIVEFFCCDLSERVTIELWGEDTSGNRNFCWNDLLLEDKVTPTCIAPWDVTIYCDDKGLEKIDDRTASAAIWGDVTVSSGADCAVLDIVYSTVKSLKCGAGYIDRIWTLTKQTVKGPITITCKQRIKILPVREYNICFPKDISADCKTPIIDTVIVDELGCDILAVNVTDKRYDASDDECYKIFRTYTVINWCAYDDRCGDPMAASNVYVVDRATFGNYGKAPLYVLVRDRLDNKRDGIEEFYLSKDLIHANADDISFNPPFCDVSGDHHHSFMYTQIIKVYDEERPVVTGIRDTFCTDPAACSASITKVVTIKDNCTDKVELERGMLMIAPFQTLDAGKMIMYATPRWSVKELTGGQFEIKVANLPEGLHDLIVVGRDECGNLSVATRIPFLVKDCKAPAPICINGLSTELMPDGNGGGMMAVWASDFVASKIYDCNGQGPETKDGLKLVTKYSLNRVGSPVVATQTSINLTCADKGKVVLVELHAWDEAGNHDFCVTFIEVQDNRNVCVGSVAAGEISGVITTDDLKPVLGVNVDLSGGAQMNQNTGSNGVYLFGNLTKESDYTVSPQLDKDHINGVSTFDLVQIQKHILGSKVIDNPYRMIAADVNNSKSISTLDMIQIRKLILNIDTKFTSVPSWKFVDATYKFPDPANPWSAQFPEVVNVNDLEGKVKADFIAIKMGDVSGNASTSGAVAVETRSDKAMIISTDEQQLQKGENYTIVFKAKDLAKIQGYQFTLNIDPSLATIEGIDYTGVMKADNFGIFAQSGMITTSFVRAPLTGAPAGSAEGETILFTLKLKAESNTALSRALILNSRLTNIEAYNQSDEVMGVQLAFGAKAVAERVALHQNVPNPFSEETAVSFYLTQAAKAVLTIRDVKGALIYRVEGNYAKGNNQLSIKQEQLKASGVLYYTLETADFTDTKKMVLLQK